jgi:effector-binding domain-containing protein
MSIEIFRDQEVVLNSVASYRGSIRNDEVNQSFNDFFEYILKTGARKKGPIISTTHEIFERQGNTYIDIEFLIPIDREVKLEGVYTFKPIFNLVHSLKVRHTGDPNLLQHVYQLVHQYIKDNHLQQITSYYNVSVNDEDVRKGQVPITDVYVGINPSIL